MKKTRLSILAAAVLAVAACQPEEQPKTSLSTNAPETITFNSDGTSANSTIMVSTDAEEWNYEMTPADGNGWLSAEKQPQSIVLTATELDSPVAGEDVTLTITAGNAAPVIITVKQMPADARFDIFPAMQSLLFEPDGSIILEGEDEPAESVSFSVDCNIPGGWDVKTEPNADWVVIEKEESVFHVSTTRNDNLEERSEVKLSVVAGEYSKDMTVAQKDAAMMELAGLEDQKVLITFTSGAIQTATIEAGKMLFGCDKENPRLIYSIKADNVENPVYIGRKDNEKITLNFKDNMLAFRDAQNGMTPLGTFSEIQMIRDHVDYWSGSYILDADVDLLGGDEIEEAGLERRNWKHLGKDQDNTFKGTFDGNSKKIYNIYCKYPLKERESQSMSLLGHCSDAIVKNVSIMSGYIHGEGGIGSIAGKSNGGYFYNCYNAATIVGNASAGGIIGMFSASYENEYKKNNIIEKCVNEGDVKFSENEADRRTGVMTGGIFGQVSGSGMVKIIDCINRGDIDGGNDVGGIAGLGQADIFNSHNEGNVNGNNNIGGIYGRFSCTRTNLNIDINKCSNSGDITGISTAGGLAGSIFTGKITASANTGDVTVSKQFAGGLVGSLSYFKQVTYIRNCYSHGNVKSADYAGGLVGKVIKAIFEGCYTTGKIECPSMNSGAIVGFMGKNSSSTEPANAIKETYWLKHGSEKAVGVDDNNNTDAKAFSASEWPSASLEFWKTGDSEGIYWKSLGEWKSGGNPDGANSTFPKLNWEK